MERLSTHYTKHAISTLKEELGIANVYALPKIMKVIVNVGIRQDQKTADLVKAIERTLMRITGQKPVPTKARMSIATFKIRAGMDIGYMVTLRGKRMDDFLTKLIHVTLPRVRDFRGISLSAVDREGNLTIGIREHIVFPEIAADDVLHIHGMAVTIVTNAHSRERSLALFRALGIPFAKEKI